MGITKESNIKVPIKIYSRTYWLSPYTSKQEKDMLIMKSFEVKDLDKFLDVLNFNYPRDISETEKKVIIWKFREISLGNEVNIRYTCDNPSCKQTQETALIVSDFVVPGTRDDPGVKKLPYLVNDENISDFVNISSSVIDELDIKQYEKLLNTIKENQIKFNFTRDVKCLSCGAEKTFSLESIDYLIDSLSDENLSSIYKVYSHLSYFGNYTKEDIDSMYPFERSIFIGLLHQIKSEQAKG